VTFTDTTTGNVLGTATVVGGPPTGTATLTVNGLTVGTHAISAAFGGTGTCGPSTGTVTVNVSGGQVISGNVFTNLTITTPTTFAPGTRVFGNVTISGSGSLSAQNVQIHGNLTATAGTGLRLCGSLVGGNTNISGINGVIVIGDAGDDGAPPCAGNTLSGTANLSGNTGFLEFSANVVAGATTVNNNTTTIVVPPENATATELEANQINSTLSCSGNVPPPTNDGKPNTVIGARTGQCAAL
jgi:hypothetical protein